MAKTITGTVKLQVKGGEAKPAPPIGPMLGSKGINIADFCKQFNAQTQDKKGVVLPVVVSVYNDRSFSFIVKTPPAAVLLMQAANIQKGSPECNRQKVASVTWGDIRVIAEEKIKELNAMKIESAMKIIAGTARSSGITVTGEFPATIT